MAKRGVIRRGGEVLSRRLLAARLIGRVAGLTLNLSETESALQRALERCEYASGEGAPLLDKQAARIIKDIQSKINSSLGVIREARAMAYKADEATRRIE